MRLQTLNNRLMWAIVLVISITTPYSQSNYASWPETSEVQDRVDRKSGVEETLIVDHTTSRKSYPSMDEEVSMYMELKGPGPKAFFFPNPSTGVVWIEHNLGSGTDLSISDDSGYTVFKAYDMEIRKVDLTRFISGNYEMTLANNTAQIRKKLIVK